MAASRLHENIRIVVHHPKPLATLQKGEHESTIPLMFATHIKTMMFINIDGDCIQSEVNN